MSKKKARKRDDRAGQAEAKTPDAPKSPTPGEVVRRRRNRRYLVLGLILVAIPIAEVIAYQFRSIVVRVVNHSGVPIDEVKLKYEGGEVEFGQILDGGDDARSIRPNFQFGRDNFSTYPITLSIKAGDAGVLRILGRAGTVDYSATEVYTVEPGADGRLEIRHETLNGFPLGTIRRWMKGLGFG